MLRLLNSAVPWCTRVMPFILGYHQEIFDDDDKNDGRKQDSSAFHSSDEFML